MTDPPCRACWNGYYIANSSKLEPANKQIIKDDPAAPNAGFALRRWVQRTQIGGQMSAAAQRTVNRNNNKDKADGNK